MQRQLAWRIQGGRTCAVCLVAVESWVVSSGLNSTQNTILAESVPNQEETAAMKGRQTAIEHDRTSKL